MQQRQEQGKGETENTAHLKGRPGPLARQPSLSQHSHTCQGGGDRPTSQEAGAAAASLSMNHPPTLLQAGEPHYARAPPPGTTVPRPSTVGALRTGGGQRVGCGCPEDLEWSLEQTDRRHPARAGGGGAGRTMGQVQGRGAAGKGGGKVAAQWGIGDPGWGSLTVGFSGQLLHNFRLQLAVGFPHARRPRPPLPGPDPLGAPSGSGWVGPGCAEAGRPGWAGPEPRLCLAVPARPVRGAPARCATSADGSRGLGDPVRARP